MGKKDIMYALQGDFGLLKTRQNAVTATAIREQILRPIAERKAGIVATGHRSIAGTQHHQGTFHAVILHQSRGDFNHKARPPSSIT